MLDNRNIVASVTQDVLHADYFAYQGKAPLVIKNAHGEITATVHSALKMSPIQFKQQFQSRLKVV